MEDVLVTGSKGLVGSHLVPLLAESRHVHALSRSGEPDPHPSVTPIAMDLSRPLDRSALPERLDSLVWLAQSNRFRDFPDGAPDMFQVNLARLHGSLEYARGAGARSFIYASTGSVYDPSPAPLTEDSPTGRAGSLGFYAASRLAAELLVGSYTTLMNVVILRFFFVYGRGQKRDMLLPRLVDNVREGRTIGLQGGSGLRINPINARDAARAVVGALSLTGTHIINVAGPETLSVREICDTAGEALSAQPVYDVKAEEKAPELIADITQMGRLLGAPAIGFEEGVADLI